MLLMFWVYFVILITDFVLNRNTSVKIRARFPPFIAAVLGQDEEQKNEHHFSAGPPPFISRPRVTMCLVLS